VSKPATLGQLKASDYRSRTVHEELRDNLIARLRSGAPTFTGIIGYEDSVLPAVENAILAGHDVIFLGERRAGCCGWRRSRPPPRPRSRAGPGSGFQPTSG
jgi:magnesium chelatase subunit I